MTATAPLSSTDTAAAPALPPAGAARPVPPPPGVTLRDFLAGPETRMRDLLAFGLAVEAGRPPAPDAVETLRRQAEADLQAHAFRLLHNQVETIRREAMEEQMARMRGASLGFGGAVVANLVALALVGGAVLLGASFDPGSIDLSPFTDRLAQLLAQISSR
jgi:hypothetical protein